MQSRCFSVIPIRFDHSFYLTAANMWFMRSSESAFILVKVLINGEAGGSDGIRPEKCEGRVRPTGFR